VRVLVVNPREWRERYAIRRYGFHGLSHAYSSRRAAELLDRPPAGLRIVTCHLGAGASLAAVVDGRSVDTTMGFTSPPGRACRSPARHVTC
jgi:acetate kinase